MAGLVAKIAIKKLVSRTFVSLSMKLCWGRHPPIVIYQVWKYFWEFYEKRRIYSIEIIHRGKRKNFHHFHLRYKKWIRRKTKLYIFVEFYNIRLKKIIYKRKTRKYLEIVYLKISIYIKLSFNLWQTLNNLFHAKLSRAMTEFCSNFCPLKLIHLIYRINTN